MIRSRTRIVPFGSPVSRTVTRRPVERPTRRPRAVATTCRTPTRRRARTRSRITRRLVQGACAASHAAPWKRITDGVFFVRYKVKGARKRMDFRRAVLVRREGRFYKRRTHYRPNSCRARSCGAPCSAAASSSR